MQPGSWEFEASNSHVGAGLPTHQAEGTSATLRELYPILALKPEA